VNELLVPQPPEIPAPWPSPVSEAYWEAARQGQLWFQRCTECGEAGFDPAAACRRCGGGLDWQRSAGLGTVSSYTVVWRPQQPAFVVPYAPAIIDLDEGYQMLANLIGCTVDDLAVGARVAVEFHPVSDGFVLPYFRPV
jgi:hypothetical protein